MIQRNFRKKGFTLLELLLYVSTAGLLLMALAIFLIMLFQARVKNQTISEVEHQGLQIMQSITQSVRNSEVINSPSAGGSASTLSLDVITGSLDPTVFDLSSGVLRIQEGVTAPVALNNSRVIVSGVSFYNTSRLGTPGIVRIQFTLTHQNPEGRNEYQYQKTFTTSAGLHQP